MRKGELAMYEIRLLELEERLHDTIEQLDRGITEERVAQGDLAHFGTHNADHDTEQLLSDAAAERNEVEILNAVEAALGRIEAGTYGICEECSKEIPRERLDAIPYAARCTGCERSSR